MKNLLFTSILLAFALTSVSQDSNPKNHEIGLNLYLYSTLGFYASGGSSFFNTLPKHNFVNGISYKFHFEKVSLRTSLNYQYKKFPDEFDPNAKDINAQYHGDVWAVGTSIGLERKYGVGKIQVIAAVDMFYQYGENSGYNGGAIHLIRDLYYHPSPIVSSSGGFSPALGLSYQMAKGFSVRLETCALMGWYKEAYEGASYNIRDGFYLSYNPISVLSANFQF